MNAFSLPALAVVATIAIPSTAAADHWMQTADPQVVQALNELLWVYGGYCQQGNPQACQMAQSIQSQGAQMLNAGYDCQVQGNQQACNWYQQAYGMLSNTYNQTQAAMTQGQFAPPSQTYANPLGETHADRMQAIQNWGAERLQWGKDQSAAMDRQHEQFMQSLRN